MTQASPDSIRKLLQLDLRDEIERIGTEQWMTVYSYDHGAEGNGGYFCALVSESAVPVVMAGDSWDMTIGDGLPGFSQSHRGKKRVTTYHRFGGASDGVEPLVFVRSFHGLKPDYIELLEEFRHALNLYYDRYNDRYLRFDRSGDEEVVAEVTPGRVTIKTRPLRQFLAMRRMHLVIFFDTVAYGSPGVDEAPPEREARVDKPDLLYTLAVGEGSLDDRRFSRLLGKRLISPLPIEECGLWPYEDKEEPCIDFIVGVDSNGKPVSHSCDPDLLANGFGKNPDAPDFLTPVVFRRDVLKKYFDHPEKYNVGDGYLGCGGLWGLRLDNDSEDRVTVFLGDLGQSLGHEEQLYWRSFNIPPFGDGKDLSETTRLRSFDAVATDPKAPDLAFKYKLTSLQERWEKHFGWQLIRPLRDEDGHVFKKLRVPLTSSAVEFEDQLLGLTKLLVDSLNDREIAKALGGALLDEKSIAKLERFLAARSYPETERDIELLRLLQESRSSLAAHRKGDSFKKVSEKLGLVSQSAPEVFSTLLRRGVVLLDGLTEFFLTPPTA